MRLGDSNFFNLFQRLAAASNRDRDCDQWNVEGVRWHRQRHIVWSSVSHQLETHELIHAVRPKWMLVLVHEIWWGSDRRKAIRNARWVHLQSGNRNDVLKWFAARESDLI